MANVLETLVNAGVLLLIAIPVVRYFYVRLYLSKRLFFEPWLNLSRNATLDVGEALAELLFFELEAIRKVLQQAESDAGLWNEKSALPVIERSFEGYPRFVRHAELLGLPGRIATLVRFVLLARPQAIRGTIHQYGSSVRFQLMLEGIRDANNHFPVRCWAISIASDQPDLIPDAISELAHSVVLDFGRVRGFKSARGFRYFTMALRQHLAYNNVSQFNYLKEAKQSYEDAIKLEGNNADASCNLADLLYSQFTYEDNEKAIQFYLGALKTDKSALRARAFRGLANAYCQRRQRHNRGDIAALEFARRWARFANNVCDETDGGLTNLEKASIKKAVAYAEQVWSELGATTDDDRARAFDEAVRLYEEAVKFNGAFTVAYNNLSYLYLHKAQTILDSTLQHEQTAARDDLQKAEEWCMRAIKSERTFHLAYDNEGNIVRAKARLSDEKITKLEQAIEAFHRALSYHPRYAAAHSDLAETHSELFQLYRSESRRQEYHASLAWQHHWDALECTLDSVSKSFLCESFEIIRSKYCLPIGDMATNQERIKRATLVNCMCFRTRESDHERDGKEFRTANP